MIILLCILIAIVIMELWVIVILSDKYNRLLEQKDCFTPIDFDK